MTDSVNSFADLGSGYTRRYVLRKIAKQWRDAEQDWALKWWSRVGHGFKAAVAFLLHREGLPPFDVMDDPGVIEVAYLHIFHYDHHEFGAAYEFDALRTVKGWRHWRYEIHTDGAP